MIRRPPRSTQSRSSAASDVYKRQDKQYKAASNVRPNEASAHMEQVLGNTVFQIPYSREVEEQVLQGNLFKELGLKESRGFRRAIEAVTGEVFGC